MTTAAITAVGDDDDAAVASVRRCLMQTWHGISVSEPSDCYWHHPDC